MNKQGSNGIEWTDYTWNPTAGCFHRCRWPAGNTGHEITCYAKKVADGLARAAYPEGFEHHYWYPERLEEPSKLRKPSRIFVGSMADVFGDWVPSEHIEAILDVVRANPQHVFQFLTKNPRRLLHFSPYPKNAWIGVSIPSAYPRGRVSDRMMTSIISLSVIDAGVRFLSAEPLWFHVEPHLSLVALTSGVGLPFDWLIIGAGSDGRTKYQPEAKWVESLLAMCDEAGVPVFMKGNLVWPNRREEFPGTWETPPSAA